MKGTLAGRLLFWVGAPAAALFLVVVLVSSFRGRERVMRETEQSSRNLARYQAQRIENRLARAAVVAETIASDLETAPQLSKPKLYEYLRNVVERHPFIYGSCIAFEPYSYDATLEYLAPYYYWKDGKPEFVQLGNPTYNYFKWEWYAAAKDAPHWSEPYYDEGGGETIMTTYSVPFHRDGKFWGIATIDIAMNELTEDVKKIRVAETGYAFVVSKAGKFLAFPDRAQIMKGSLFDIDAELARRMTSGEDGFIRAKGPWQKRDARIAFVPISAGGLSLGVVYPSDELMMQAAAVQTDLLTIGIIGLLGLAAMLVIIVRSFSRPIAALAEAAQRIAAGDLDFQLETKTRTREVNHLTQAFRTMTADLKKRIEDLRHATAQREKIEGELSAARTIQSSILPQKFPLFPDRREIDVHAIVKSAHEVGGDFFDVYFVDDDWLCIVIGDVSGKGVPAALFMAVTMTMMKAHTRRAISPAKILARVNRELCRQNHAGMFVTIFCGLLNCRTGSFVYCNAGHNAPFVLSQTGALAQLKERGGIALGAVESARYEDSETRLKSSDTLFCWTDGITEATSASGGFFGEAELAKRLAESAQLAPDKLTTYIVEEVQRFSSGSEQADDITVLALRFLGRESAERGRELSENGGREPAAAAAVVDDDSRASAGANAIACPS